VTRCIGCRNPPSRELFEHPRYPRRVAPAAQTSPDASGAGKRLLCPRCASTDIHAAILDLAPLTVERLLESPRIDPLSYGYVATCNSCTHKWKP